jgi:hypothetical protein
MYDKSPKNKDVERIACKGPSSLFQLYGKSDSVTRIRGLLQSDVDEITDSRTSF